MERRRHTTWSNGGRNPGDHVAIISFALGFAFLAGHCLGATVQLGRETGRSTRSHHCRSLCKTTSAKTKQSTICTRSSVEEASTYWPAGVEATVEQSAGSADPVTTSLAPGGGSLAQWDVMCWRLGGLFVGARRHVPSHQGPASLPSPTQYTIDRTIGS